MPAATARAPDLPNAAVAPRTDARLAVRDALVGADGFAALDGQTQTALAGSLARIGSAALDLDEATSAPARPPVALAQNAGSEFSGVAVDRVAGTTRNIMNAVSFPRFVNELITGVFKAMNDSNQQQLTAFVDLIRNVAQSTEGFADANVGVSGARSWLAENFPGSYVIQGGDEVDMASELEGLSPAEARERRAEIQAEQDAATRIEMRPGGQAPTEAALRSALGAPDGVPLPASNPEALVPLARQVLARNRQQLLATMIQMGLQRIVIESGRVNAAMKLHVDASSAAENDRGSQFDMRNTTEVGVGAKFGPWGAEAKMQNTIGYVSTDRTSTTENINASVDLDSGVELVFRTDYVPLDRLAGRETADRIQVNTLNPETESARLTAEAEARRAASEARREERRSELARSLPAPPSLPEFSIDTSAIRGDAVAPPARSDARRDSPGRGSSESSGSTDGTAGSSRDGATTGGSSTTSGGGPSTGGSTTTTSGSSTTASGGSSTGSGTTTGSSSTTSGSGTTTSGSGSSTSASPTASGGSTTSSPSSTTTGSGSGVKSTTTASPTSPTARGDRTATSTSPGTGAAVGSTIGSLVGGEAGGSAGKTIGSAIERLAS